MNGDFFFCDDDVGGGEAGSLYDVYPCFCSGVGAFFFPECVIKKCSVYGDESFHGFIVA